METTRVSSKGQIVLPKALREAQHWEPGTELTAEAVKDGILLRPVQRPRTTTLDDVFGCLKSMVRLPSAPTVEDMDAAIEAEVRERHDRGRY